MDLEQALARIAELEGQVTAISGERDAATGERDTLAGHTSELEAARADLDARLAEATGAHSTVAADLAAAQRALSAAHTSGLANLRRALLAEQAGRIVPELVGGDDEEALLASVEVAKQAYSRAVEAARASIAQQTVPAGAPSADAASAVGLSPLEMIETGLRR
jgi:chromosome segregation ATPase